MKYLVTLAGRTLTVEVDGDRVTIDGQERTALLSPVPGTPLRRLLVDGRPLGLALAGKGRGLWELTVDGEAWEAEVLDERTRHIRELAGAGGRSHGPGALRAPMPGLVVRVHAQAGQAVVAGTGLVVLEAMKMENELRASGPATIKTVHAQPGDTVDKGQLLVEFE